MNNLKVGNVIVLIPLIRSYRSNKARLGLTRKQRKVLIPLIRSYRSNPMQSIIGLSRNMQMVLIPLIRSYRSNYNTGDPLLCEFISLNPFNQVISF